jgi:hypothetical protein
MLNEDSFVLLQEIEDFQHQLKIEQQREQLYFKEYKKNNYRLANDEIGFHGHLYKVKLKSEDGNDPSYSSKIRTPKHIDKYSAVPQAFFENNLLGLNFLYEDELQEEGNIESFLIGSDFIVYDAEL